jgi:hypothetical protein
MSSPPAEQETLYLNLSPLTPLPAKCQGLGRLAGRAREVAETTSLPLLAKLALTCGAGGDRPAKHMRWLVCVRT